MSKFYRSLVSCFLAGWVGSPLLFADDTDIYYSSLSGGARPLVMLTLDLRSNLANTECSDVFADACRDNLSDALYLNLDLVTAVDPNSPIDPNDPNDIVEGPDGIPDAQYFVTDPNAPVASEIASMHAAWTTAIDDGSYMDEKARLFDILRAAFQFIINDEQVQASGLWLGMMVMHQHDSDCAGPGDIPSGNQSGCSGGAYILKDFFDITDETQVNDFHKRLATLPTPTYTPTNPGGTWNGHTYQLAELYFEFYRYITGQDMYNGWLGYTDYNSKSTDAYDYHKQNITEAGNDAPYGIWDDKDEYVAPDTNAYTGAYTASGGSVTYQSPFDEGDIDDWKCSGLYMINTLFGVGQQDADSNSAIAASYGSGGLELDLGNSNTDDDRNDLIAWMKNTDLAGYLDPNDPTSTLIGVDVEGDQGLTSYFLSKTTNNKQDDYAAAGGTDYALSLGDGAEIRDSLKAIFDSIISESSTLVAASVPVNVLDRSQSVDNVYLAIFQAESGTRWPGNVKKLKIGRRPVYDQQGRLLEYAPQIQDANGAAAFDPVTGRINDSALTFWTDPSGEDVTPSGCVDGDAPLEEQEQCGKDGRSVDRGGAGQQILGFNSNDSCAYNTGPGLSNGVDACARTLYTEDPGTALTLMDFDADTTTADDLAPYIDPTYNPAAPSNATALKLIKWARGATELSGALAEANQKRWMMADVLHSRPLPVNYGGRGLYDPNEPDIRLFFGSNDGWFRMVKNTTSGGAESGEEVWGFMPLEVMGIQYDLATDTPPTNGAPHPYGVDGEVTALVIDKDSDGVIENGNNSAHSVNSTTGEIGSGDKVLVYFGLRRGGHAYYGLDVSNPDAAPVLMWKISNTDSDFSELGMSFSTPRIAYVNHDGMRRAVLVFGGGYNGGWNSDGTRVGKDQSGTGTNDSVGNAIYVVDAVTGDLIWKASDDSGTGLDYYQQSAMVDSIPSEMALLDIDQNGTMDLAYVGDTGGNVWRVDMPEYTPVAYPDGDQDSRVDWSVTKVATLGRHMTGASASDDRRFFHPPGVVLGIDQENLGDNTNPDIVNREIIGLLISSGDRADPKGTSVANWMYFIKDSNVSSGTAQDSALTHGVLTDVSSGDCGGTVCTVEDLENGWRRSLGQTGEKGLSRPTILRGTVFYTTYLPEGEAAEGECASGLGSGRLYGVSVVDGEDVIPPAELDPPGIPPPEIPLVDIDTQDPNDPVPDPNAIDPNDPDWEGCDVSGMIGGEFIETNAQCRWRAYWYEQGVDDI